MAVAKVQKLASDECTDSSGKKFRLDTINATHEGSQSGRCTIGQIGLVTKLVGVALAPSRECCAIVLINRYPPLMFGWLFTHSKRLSIMICCGLVFSQLPSMRNSGQRLSGKIGMVGVMSISPMLNWFSYGEYVLSLRCPRSVDREIYLREIWIFQ